MIEISLRNGGQQGVVIAIFPASDEVVIKVPPKREIWKVFPDRPRLHKFCFENFASQDRTIDTVFSKIPD